MISDLGSSRDAKADAKAPKLAEVPAVLIRGGTSKGVFLHARDVPPCGAERDRLILRLMGSPDPMQIDGLGGTYSSTSKVVVVASGPEDGMVTYWFGQVGIDSATVEWAGNCGNLTTAVGSFAIDENLVPARAPITTVRLLNANTGITVEAQVPVTYGRACTEGDLKVAGVPGRGAPVMMRYLNPGGGVLGRVLPTGNATDQIETPFGEVAVSLVDVTHPYAFVHANDLDLQIEDVSPVELNTDSRTPDMVRSFT